MMIPPHDCSASPRKFARARRFLMALGFTAAALALAPRGVTGDELLVGVPTALRAGDRLVYEVGAAFGFDGLPKELRDPAVLETRISIGVGQVDGRTLDVDVELAVGVRAVRYRGPDFAFSIEPVTKDGFVAGPLSSQEAQRAMDAPIPHRLSPAVRDLVQRQLSLVTTIASLHGRHASARVSVGPDPFARIDEVDGEPLGPERRLLAERYLRACLLLAFPPSPEAWPALTHERAPRFTAGGAAYEVLGTRDAYWPIQGREIRVRALGASSAARAAFAFEALHDVPLEPTSEREPEVRERADIHPGLGIAGRRHVRVATALGPADEARKEPAPPSVVAVATWSADLVRATRRK